MPSTTRGSYVPPPDSGAAAFSVNPAVDVL